MENNNLHFLEKNNLSYNDMNIINILKNKIYRQINTYVKHKKSLQAFNNYVNSLGNDKVKLTKV